MNRTMNRVEKQLGGELHWPAGPPNTPGSLPPKAKSNPVGKSTE
jgi:hypothetical protein